MTFKEEMLKDIDDVFLNLDEFGETHNINGKPVVCMLDDDALKLRQGSNELSISDSSLLLFAKTSDLPRKVVGDDLTIDGKIYIVDDWKVNLGMAEVVLHRNVSY